MHGSNKIDVYEVDNSRSISETVIALYGAPETVLCVIGLLCCPEQKK